MMRFQVQVEIDATEADMTYHGQTLDETVLAYIVKEIIYNHTNVYDSQIQVSVMRLGDEHTSNG
jgi:hypothetical protein